VVIDGRTRTENLVLLIQIWVQLLGSHSVVADALSALASRLDLLLTQEVLLNHVDN
jgi:hypothetical protein